MSDFEVGKLRRENWEMGRWDFGELMDFEGGFMNLSDIEIKVPFFFFKANINRQTNLGGKGPEREGEGVGLGGSGRNRNPCGTI